MDLTPETQTSRLAELRARGFVFREAHLLLPADQELVIAFMLELQRPGRDRYEYEGMPPDHVANTHERLIPLLREVQGRVFLGYTPEGNAVAIAVCNTHISTWQLRRILNLQDFYTQEAYRGQGIGSALLEMMIETARAEGCCRVTLECRASNVRALKLYAQYEFVGAGTSTSDDVVFQLKLVL